MRAIIEVGTHQIVVATVTRPDGVHLTLHTPTVGPVAVIIGPSDARVLSGMLALAAAEADRNEVTT